MTDKEFLEELENHPNLKDRFKEILSISANNGKELITLGDEAELRVISQMRQLGKETLQNWADKESKRISKNVKSQIKEAKNHVKKNSDGTPPTEK
jgi:gas vesicle protein